MYCYVYRGMQQSYTTGQSTYMYVLLCICNIAIHTLQVWAATHKLCHGGLAGWRDVLQELQSVVGPAVDDMHSYSVVHVVLQWSIAPGGGHIRTHGVSTIAV